MPHERSKTDIVTDWVFAKITPAYLGHELANFVVGLQAYYPEFYQKGVGRLLEDPYLERFVWGTTWVASAYLLGWGFAKLHNKWEYESHRFD